MKVDCRFPRPICAVPSSGLSCLKSSRLTEQRPLNEHAYSSIIIELVQRDPRLAGQVHKRCGEESERHDEEHRYSALVLDFKKSAHERDDHKQCHKDRADRCE